MRMVNREFSREKGLNVSIRLFRFRRLQWCHSRLNRSSSCARLPGPRLTAAFGEGQDTRTILFHPYRRRATIKFSRIQYFQQFLGNFSSFSFSFFDKIKQFFEIPVGRGDKITGRNRKIDDGRGGEISILIEIIRQRRINFSLYRRRLLAGRNIVGESPASPDRLLASRSRPTPSPV